MNMVCFLLHMNSMMKPKGAHERKQSKTKPKATNGKILNGNANMIEN